MVIQWKLYNQHVFGAHTDVRKKQIFLTGSRKTIYISRNSQKLEGFRSRGKETTVTQASFPKFLVSDILFCFAFPTLCGTRLGEETLTRKYCFALNKLLHQLLINFLTSQNAELLQGSSECCIDCTDRFEGSAIEHQENIVGYSKRTRLFKRKKNCHARIQTQISGLTYASNRQEERTEAEKETSPLK